MTTECISPNCEAEEVWLFEGSSHWEEYHALQDDCRCDCPEHSSVGSLGRRGFHCLYGGQACTASEYTGNGHSTCRAQQSFTARCRPFTGSHAVATDDRRSVVSL